MYYIGADCSGLKTSMFLANDNKEIINTITAGPACYGEMGVFTVVDVVSDALVQLLYKINIQTKDCCAVFSFSYAEHNSALDIQIERLLSVKFAGFSLVNDSVAAFNAAFSDECGVSVIAATGSIAYGQDGNGNIARCGGYGRFASDEGSGYWLGHEAIRLFYNQCDGRISKSGLYKEMCRHLQISDEYGMINITERRFADDRYAVEQLQSVLAQAALTGDEAAQQIFKKAAYGLANLAAGVRKQLGLPAQQQMRVSYSGSVFAAGDLILLPFKNALSELNFELVKPQSCLIAQGALNIAYKIC